MNNKYKEYIKFYTDTKQPLGYDEAILLLSEIIGDKELDKAVNDYVDRLDDTFEILKQIQELAVKW